MKNFFDKDRTDYCGNFRSSNIGDNVVVKGWVARKRSLGALVFIDIRDKTGIVQAVVSEDADYFIKEKVKTLGSEYVVAVSGTVRKRSSINTEIPTGEIEILIENIHIYSESKTPPIHISDDDNVGEQNRLKYRYLDLRKPYMQKMLKYRHDLIWSIRSFLTENAFTEVETPILAKSTPEGARDYLVPSRIQKGTFYALPQSPQIFKQLMMISGLDKYYQIAKCFRDEDLRADRQPEFTQIDLEMSFVNQEDVMNLAEKMIKKAFKDVINVDLPENIPHMTYDEAMRLYGSDKPDTRFGMLLEDYTDILSSSGFNVFENTVKEGGCIKGIVVKEGLKNISKKSIKNFEKSVKKYGAKGLVWIAYEENEISSSVSKFLCQEDLMKIIKKSNAQKEDLIFIIADKSSVVNVSLGGLRLEIAKKLNLIDENKYEVLWVVDFPMFEYDDETKRFYAKHHPFTMPNYEDHHLLGKDNLSVRAYAYDFVCNGYELGGGSIRIHDSKIQEKVFNELDFSKEDIEKQFGFFVDALKYGTPPHGGIALGIDRFTMLLGKTENIKDVIAFPKNQSAVCPMSDAPSSVSEYQLSELGIKLDVGAE